MVEERDKICNALEKQLDNPSGFSDEFSKLVGSNFSDMNFDKLRETCHNKENEKDDTIRYNKTVEDFNEMYPNNKVTKYLEGNFVTQSLDKMVKLCDSVADILVMFWTTGGIGGTLGKASMKGFANCSKFFIKDICEKNYKEAIAQLPKLSSFLAGAAHSAPTMSAFEGGKALINSATNGEDLTADEILSRTIDGFIGGAEMGVEMAGLQAFAIAPIMNKLSPVLGKMTGASSKVKELLKKNGEMSLEEISKVYEDCIQTTRGKIAQEGLHLGVSLPVMIPGFTGIDSAKAFLLNGDKSYNEDNFREQLLHNAKTQEERVRISAMNSFELKAEFVKRNFQAQLEGMTTIEGVSLALRRFQAARLAGQAVPKPVNNLLGAKIKTVEKDGKPLYEVVQENGKTLKFDMNDGKTVSKFSSPERAIAAYQAMCVKVVSEFKAELEKADNIPNHLPQGAREQGEVRANSKKSSMLVGDNVGVSSAVDFSKFSTNRRIKGFDKNLNPSQLTEAELQAKKQVEEYLKNNFPDLATQDNINILKDAWLKSSELTQKALNNSRKFNVTEIFSLVEAYQLEPNLTEKYLNIKSENGAYRFHPFDVKYLVKAHLTDATRTEELINTKTKNGQYKYDSTEVLSLVEAYQMNTKATDMLLYLKNEQGEPRFNAGSIKSLVEAYNKNPELVEDLLTQEYYKGKIRHKAQNIVDAVKAYEIDPKRFKEILDEKGQPPYDYMYMHDGSDALKFIEAEQIDSKVAKMLEAQYQEGGLPRFSSATIRFLTEVYNEHPQTLDRILNIKNTMGIYKFFQGYDYVPEKDSFNTLIEEFEKYPEILEIAENNETVMGFGTLCYLLNAYKKNPELTTSTLNLKNPNGSPRFDISSVDYLVEANEANPTLTKELLDYKTADGKEYRFDAINIREVVNADKINHEFTKDLLTQKESDGSFYSGIAIERIVSAKETSPDIYDYAIKNGFSSNDASKIVEAYNQSKDLDLVKLLMGYKNSEGKSKFNGQDIIRIIMTIYDAPHNKAKILDYLNNDISINSIDDLLEMENILSKAEFDKLKNSFNSVVDYCKTHNIKYDHLYILENKEFQVLLDENGYSYLAFDADGKMIQESILDSTNPNFSKESLIDKNGDRSILARIESEPLGYEDFAFYTDNIKTVKDVDGNFLYKEFCLKSKDVEGKFDVWREEANGKKYKIGLAEKTPAGEIVLEKTLVANDGTKTDYNYMQSPNGSRLVYTKITEPDGKITENRQQFKIIDNNHAVSIENGMKYEIEYQTDKITVTKDNGEKVELSIGSNERESEGIISKDLLPIIKMLPGSVLCDIKEFGLKKVWLNTNKANEGNAFFVANSGTIELSEKNSAPKNACILLHELGHYRDYFKFRKNTELNNIFKTELETFNKTATKIEKNAIDYLINIERPGSSLKPGGMQTEFIAETNAIMHSANFAPFIEMRGQYLQKYFPKTFAKVVELLKETGVQEYKPESAITEKEEVQKKSTQTTDAEDHDVQESVTTETKRHSMRGYTTKEESETQNNSTQTTETEHHGMRGFATKEELDKQNKSTKRPTN